MGKVAIYISAMTSLKELEFKSAFFTACAMCVL
jgi:hypothetical protein